MQSQTSSGLKTWPEYIDPVDQTLFPGAIASVCLFWRNVMMSQTSFWSRILVNVDEEPTSLATIRKHLALSNEHPLHVYLSRRAGHYGSEDLAEKVRVAAVLQLLLPHWGRIWTLHLDVLHAVSLPRVGFELGDFPPAARSIQLVSHIHDSIPCPIGSMAIPPTKASHLTSLYLDVSAFRDILQGSSGKILPNSVRYLMISGDGHGSLRLPVRPLAHCLQRLPDLTALRFVGVRIDIADARLPASAQLRCLRELEFEEMDWLLVCELCYQLRLDEHEPLHKLKLKGCTAARIFIGMFMWLPPSSHLCIEDIDSSEVVDYILGAFCRPCSQSLEVVHCRGFDIDVLNSLFDIRGNNHSLEWLCRFLERLTIKDCTEFSSSELMSTVDARRVAWERTDSLKPSDEEFELSPIGTLLVSGCGELEPDDQEWFDENVAHVQWDGWIGGFRHTGAPEGTQETF
ncbi:hypothetical protein WOLCODRAFT_165095 [Wolfiporia cocos MD-104 SS10]|uniref:F-box domain-containing protein n=1 Tax=Wolfiporia cocos (strain MD-104) TaxID=742152 RepID=A0A2H3JQE6_WOLCO|nr:hypothetical protein WOLCODRAFT_165095 [Wolfiporia cocos MD-104 SS10]